MPQSAKGRHAGLLPPLDETNFSEQYKLYMGKQLNQILPPLNNQFEIPKDFHSMIKKDISNKPNLKRAIYKPNIFAEESFPLNYNQPVNQTPMGGPQHHHSAFAASYPGN